MMDTASAPDSPSCLGDPEGALAHQRRLLLAEHEREKDELVALLEVRRENELLAKDRHYAAREKQLRDEHAGLVDAFLAKADAERRKQLDDLRDSLAAVHGEELRRALEATAGDAAAAVAKAQAEDEKHHIEVREGKKGLGGVGAVAHATKLGSVEGCAARRGRGTSHAASQPPWQRRGDGGGKRQAGWAAGSLPHGPGGERA